MKLLSRFFSRRLAVLMGSVNCLGGTRDVSQRNTIIILEWRNDAKAELARSG